MLKRKRYNLSSDSIHDSKIGIKYHLDDKLADLLNNLDRRINWFKTLVNSIYGLPVKNKEKIELSDKIIIILPKEAKVEPKRMISLLKWFQKWVSPNIKKISLDKNDLTIHARNLLEENICLKEELANRPTMKDLYPPQMIKLANQDKIELLEKLKKHYCKMMWDGRSSSDAWVIQECVDLIDKELANIRRTHESS